jgi:putative membrane protein (TIGR04086 family)
MKPTQTGFALFVAWFIAYFLIFVSRLLFIAVIPSETPFISFLLIPIISVFIAGALAGYMASNKGWQVGLVTGIIVIFFDVVKPHAMQLRYGNMVVSYVLLLIASTIGGHFGQLLAQKWHKKSDVSRGL